MIIQFFKLYSKLKIQTKTKRQTLAKTINLMCSPPVRNSSTPNSC
jgi:hypothetical protein